MVGKKNNLFNDQAQETTPKRSRNAANEEKDDGFDQTFETPSASSVSTANSSLGQGLNSFSLI